MSRSRGDTGEKASSHWMNEIDPTSIPDWPHPVITVNTDGVDIDGGAVELPVDVEPTSRKARQLAVREVASRYAELRRPIAVRGRDPDGTGWDLIVAPDGRVLSAADAPTEYLRRKGFRHIGRRRHGSRTATNSGSHAIRAKRRGVVGVAVFVVLVIVLGGTAFNVAGEDRLPVASRRGVASTPPAANLPVEPPPGYGGRAVWALPVDKDSRLTVTPTHEVAFVNEHGDLEVRDVATGVLRWQKRLPSMMGTGVDLFVTRIDGLPVLALVRASTLLYWRLDDREHELHRVRLPGGNVDFDGGSPLVVLPDQTAAYVSSGRVRLVDIPVGARAISSSGAAVTAVDSVGRLWTLRGGDGAIPAATRIRGPAKDAVVLRAAGLPNGMFVIVWRHGGKRTAILYDSPGGGEIVRRSMPALEPLGRHTEGFEIKVETSEYGDVVTVGDVMFFPKERVARRIDGLSVSTVSHGHVYGDDDSGEWFDLTVTGRNGIEAEESVPRAVDDAGALVVAQKLDKTRLYMLPTVVTAPSSTPSRVPPR